MNPSPFKLLRFCALSRAGIHTDISAEHKRNENLKRSLRQMDEDSPCQRVETESELKFLNNWFEVKSPATDEKRSIDFFFLHPAAVFDLLASDPSPFFTRIHNDVSLCTLSFRLAPFSCLLPCYFMPCHECFSFSTTLRPIRKLFHPGV